MPTDRAPSDVAIRSAPTAWPWRPARPASRSSSRCPDPTIDQGTACARRLPLEQRPDEEIMVPAAPAGPGPSTWPSTSPQPNSVPAVVTEDRPTPRGSGSRARAPVVTAVPRRHRGSSSSVGFPVVTVVPRRYRGSSSSPRRRGGHASRWCQRRLPQPRRNSSAGSSAQTPYLRSTTRTARRWPPGPAPLRCRRVPRRGTVSRQYGARPLGEHADLVESPVSESGSDRSTLRPKSTRNSRPSAAPPTPWSGGQMSARARVERVDGQRRLVVEGQALGGAQPGHPAPRSPWRPARTAWPGSRR